MIKNMYLGEFKAIVKIRYLLNNMEVTGELFFRYFFYSALDFLLIDSLATYYWPPVNC